MEISKLSVTDIFGTLYVSRWHMVRMRRRNSLAEHHYMVAMLATKLARGLANPLTLEQQHSLLTYALTHDAPELEYGDFPTPAKRYISQSPEAKAALNHMEWDFWNWRGVNLDDKPVDPLVKGLVKLADLLDAAIYYYLEGANADWRGKPIRVQRVEECLNFCWNNFRTLTPMVELAFYEMKVKFEARYTGDLVAVTFQDL